MYIISKLGTLSARYLLALCRRKVRTVNTHIFMHIEFARQYMMFLPWTLIGLLHIALSSLACATLHRKVLARGLDDFPAVSIMTNYSSTVPITIGNNG